AASAALRAASAAFWRAASAAFRAASRAASKAFWRAAWAASEIRRIILNSSGDAGRARKRWQCPSIARPAAKLRPPVRSGGIPPGAYLGAHVGGAGLRVATRRLSPLGRRGDFRDRDLLAVRPHRRLLLEPLQGAAPRRRRADEGQQLRRHAGLPRGH